MGATLLFMRIIVIIFNINLAIEAQAMYSLGDFPYLGYLVCGVNRTSCMATLVSPMFMLTSASCFKQICYEAHLLNNDITYEVGPSFWPVDYAKGPFHSSYFDVGLVKLTPYVELSEQVHVVTIAKRIEMSKCITVIWNNNELQIFDLSSAYGHFLQCAEEQYPSQNLCSSFRTYRPKYGQDLNFCLYRNKGMPLICSGMIVGLFKNQNCYTNEDPSDQDNQLFDIDWVIIASANKLIDKVLQIQSQTNNDKGKYKLSEKRIGSSDSLIDKAKSENDNKGSNVNILIKKTNYKAPNELSKKQIPSPEEIPDKEKRKTYDSRHKVVHFRVKTASDVTIPRNLAEENTEKIYEEESSERFKRYDIPDSFVDRPSDNLEDDEQYIKASDHISKNFSTLYLIFFSLCLYIL